MSSRSTNHAVDNQELQTQIQQALLKIREAELPHLRREEIQPQGKRLPPLERIGRDGTNHLNMFRHTYPRSDVGYTLSFSNRVSFVLPGISRPLVSLGSLYAFLRAGGKFPDGLDLDITNDWRHYRYQHQNEVPVPNMYAVLAYAVWTKFTTVPGFADLLKATGDLPFDYYLPGTSSSDPQRFGDSDVVASIFGHVRRCINSDRAPMFYSYLDEPTRVSFEIQHKGIRVTPEIKTDYAMAAIEMVLGSIDEGVKVYMSDKEAARKRKAARTPVPPAPAPGQKVRQTPSQVVANRLNPNGYTYQEIISGKAAREQKEREAQAEFAAQQDAQATAEQQDDDQANNERFALAAGPNDGMGEQAPAPINPVVKEAMQKMMPRHAELDPAIAAAIVGGTQVIPQRTLVHKEEPVQEAQAETATEPVAEPLAPASEATATTEPADAPADEQVEVSNRVLNPDMAAALRAIPQEAK